MNAREIIAKRVAKELKDKEIVNLGIGIPTLVPNFIDCSKEIIFQCDNGVLGINPCEKNDAQLDMYYQDAGGQKILTHNYGCFFDAPMAFDMIGGGHIDTTILGALQVDQYGSVASWKIPNKFTPGIGGAMDLVCGAKKVIIAIEHLSKGNIKILEKCTFPLTGYRCVDLIVTEFCVLKPSEDGLILLELRSDISLEKLKELTGGKIIKTDNTKEYEI